jgi:hypothetical protein
LATALDARRRRLTALLPSATGTGASFSPKSTLLLGRPPPSIADRHPSHVLTALRAKKKAFAIPLGFYEQKQSSSNLPVVTYATVK